MVFCNKTNLIMAKVSLAGFSTAIVVILYTSPSSDFTDSIEDIPGIVKTALKSMTMKHTRKVGRLNKGT